MSEEEDDIYSRKGGQRKVENDEISPQEAGFMEGYESTEWVECSECGESAVENPIEREIDGEMYTFCSVECAEKFLKKKREEE